VWNLGWRSGRCSAGRPRPPGSRCCWPWRFAALRLLCADGVVAAPAATPERATTADLALDKPLTAGEHRAGRRIRVAGRCPQASYVPPCDSSYLPSPDSALQSEWSPGERNVGTCFDEIDYGAIPSVSAAGWPVRPRWAKDPGCYLTPGRSNPESPR